MGSSPARNRLLTKGQAHSPPGLLLPSDCSSGQAMHRKYTWQYILPGVPLSNFKRNGTKQQSSIAVRLPYKFSVTHKSTVPQAESINPTSIAIIQHTGHRRKKCMHSSPLLPAAGQRSSPAIVIPAYAVATMRAT
eukprot:GHUV01057633.1.p1 GENE.GHUV01057633.1~~GHUV01057633.1.p1  ORF type:complete len:135 (-),score=10.11 GHUV01057633.1:98-502(-)